MSTGPLPREGERERFEKWARPLGYDLSPDPFGDDPYQDVLATHAFDAWQARAAEVDYAKLRAVLEYVSECEHNVAWSHGPCEHRAALNAALRRDAR